MCTNIALLTIYFSQNFSKKKRIMLDKSVLIVQNLKVVYVCILGRTKQGEIALDEKTDLNTV